jgi:hypothetical protein
MREGIPVVNSIENNANNFELQLQSLRSNKGRSFNEFDYQILTIEMEFRWQNVFTQKILHKFNNGVNETKIIVKLKS